MSEDYSYLEVQTVVDSDNFTLTVSNAGLGSGTSGAYIPAAKITNVTQTGGDMSALEVEVPSTNVGNITINKLRTYTAAQGTNNATIVVTLPSGLENGAGGFTTKKNINLITATIITVNGTSVNGDLTPVVGYNLGNNPINEVSITSGWFGEECIMSLLFV